MKREIDTTLMDRDMAHARQTVKDIPADIERNIERNIGPNIALKGLHRRYTGGSIFWSI